MTGKGGDSKTALGPTKEAMGAEAASASASSDATQITPLSYEEQVELHRDWKQVKVENKDLSTRLRSAKAAVSAVDFWLNLEILTCGILVVDLEIEN